MSLTLPTVELRALLHEALSATLATDALTLPAPLMYTPAFTARLCTWRAPSSADGRARARRSGPGP
ncbi:hypothetical protein [Streptomyces sp. NPDC002221]|uniref:hypothetical protein n=1 Tax=Streptomyces sp. NPDC002221 TaxID=3364639 RepID=UPI0036CDAEEF